MTDTPLIERVRELVEPIASDLDLDLYDLEQRGGTLRVTIDTPPGSEGGIDMDRLALATRLISREMDHHDPMPGRYTLEVTSPGVERTLRTPAHFRREVGKTISVRLANAEAEQRRFEGVLVAADDTTATVRIDDGQLTERVVRLSDIDRARTVFVWGPTPKPGGKNAPKNKNATKKPKRPKRPEQSSDRQPSDQRRSERQSSDRQPSDQPSDQQRSERQSSDRQPSDQPSDRHSSDRQPSDRRPAAGGGGQPHREGTDRQQPETPAVSPSTEPSTNKEPS